MAGLPAARAAPRPADPVRGDGVKQPTPMDINQLIAHNGACFYAIAFIWTFLEGETVILFAGFAAAQGLVDPLLLLAVAWLGSFSGDQCYFWLGRRFGVRLLDRFRRWLFPRPCLPRHARRPRAHLQPRHARGFYRGGRRHVAVASRAAAPASADRGSARRQGGDPAALRPQPRISIAAPMSSPRTWS